MEVTHTSLLSCLVLDRWSYQVEVGGGAAQKSKRRIGSSTLIASMFGYRGKLSYVTWHLNSVTLSMANWIKFFCYMQNVSSLYPGNTREILFPYQIKLLGLLRLLTKVIIKKNKFTNSLIYLFYTTSLSIIKIATCWTYMKQRDKYYII